ncbi:MAG: periplasmic heavy metal sensor [Candidatus Zixiibacteriota bacterium]|nr:MAG: periplasmic heavy metal sensor [candidate division Zixibacteria bacterium]
MRKSGETVILFFLGVLLCAPVKLFAQGPPHHPGGPPASMAERKKIRENIETLRMYKLLEALDLTSEQSAEFLPALKEFQDSKRKFHEDRRAFLKELEDALESEENDEKKLEQTLTALESTREEFQAEFTEFLEKARTMLTLQQRARLQLFEERFERRLRDSIRQMRGKEHRMDESR